jgi:diguanylate cyclase (GGDEF)-like protein
MGHASRTGRSGALLWLDIDFFKEINDSLGHQAGDQVLVGIAAAATRCLRADSFIARLGGDEFAVLLPDTDRAQAEECAERLTLAIREASSLFEGRSLRVTSSVGVVLYPDHGATVEELLARADLAMYRAKEDGRNRYVVYEATEGWHDEQRVRFNWSTQIETALRDDLFIVYAQPVLNIADDSIDRHELLIRMEGEDGSILPPASFLHVAERTGLIHQIDRWMVRRAIDLISMKAGRDASFRLDVNLSGRAFSDTELLATIESELIRTGIAPASFGVEITETAAVSDMGKARAFITRLRALGCRVSLDDFGSGFSSFYYLKNLPIDCLKIDGSFIQNMTLNLQDQHVVKAMVELAEGFGITSTAEFVEDGATLEMLKAFGVTYAQGFHISRPMPVGEIAEHLGSGAAGSEAESA